MLEKASQAMQEKFNNSPLQPIQDNLVLLAIIWWRHHWIISIKLMTFILQDWSFFSMLFLGYFEHFRPYRFIFEVGLRTFCIWTNSFYFQSIPQCSFCLSLWWFLVTTVAHPTFKLCWSCDCDWSLGYVVTIQILLVVFKVFSNSSYCGKLYNITRKPVFADSDYCNKRNPKCIWWKGLTFVWFSAKK